VGFGAVLQMFALSDYQKIKVLLLEDQFVQNAENKLNGMITYQFSLTFS